MTTRYSPPIQPVNPRWLEAAKEFAANNQEPNQYDWYFDPAFPITLLYGAESDRALWEIFTAENESRTDLWGREDSELSDYRPDEQYYDSYWGWWNHPHAANGNDCPIVVFDNGAWDTWDGWHRSLIARLARIRSMPAIVGMLKSQEE
jgi:hypothetical protein